MDLLGQETQTCLFPEHPIPSCSEFTSACPLIFLHIEITLRKDAVTSPGTLGGTLSSYFLCWTGGLDDKS